MWRINKDYIKTGKVKNWKEITPIINEQLRNDESEYRDESAYRKPVQYAEAFYEDVFSKMMGDKYLEELRIQQRETKKERVKLQTEKLEYNKWVREDARDEMFEEKTIEAIKKYGSFSNPPTIIPKVHNKREGILCIADAHFGKEFKIYGLFDEVINEYSPEIFYSRMEQIYNDTLEIVEKEKLNTIHVYNLGDHVEGFIRNNQLWSLRWGVVDSGVIFGNYMGD